MAYQKRIIAVCLCLLGPILGLAETITKSGTYYYTLTPSTSSTSTFAKKGLDVKIVVPAASYVNVKTKCDVTGGSNYDGYSMASISPEGLSSSSSDMTVSCFARVRSRNGWNATYETKFTISVTYNFELSFDFAGGKNGSTSVVVEQGATPPSIKVPTRDGYEFGGYFTERNGAGIQYYAANGRACAGRTADAGLTLYAYWVGSSDPEDEPEVKGSVSISGYARELVSGNITYLTCVFRNESGSSKVVNGEWRAVKGGEWVTIDEYGCLKAGTVTKSKDVKVVATYDGLTTEPYSLKVVPPDPFWISIDGPSEIVGHTSERYACTLHYRDGTTKEVLPEWSFSGDSYYAQYLEDGVVQAKSPRSQTEITLNACYAEDDVTVSCQKKVTITPSVYGKKWVAVEGPWCLVSGCTSAYRLLVKYEDGYLEYDASASWSRRELDRDYGSLSSDGKLTAKSVSRKQTVDITGTARWDITNISDRRMSSTRTVTILPEGVVPMSLSIDGAESVTSGGSTQLVCTVHYSDGSSRSVVPTWSIKLGSANAAISESGELTAGTVGRAQTITVHAAYSEMDIDLTVEKTVSITYDLPPWCLVRYDANGGESDLESEKIRAGKRLGELPLAEYAGHDFVGWFTDREAGEPVTPDRVVTEDTVYYARWAATDTDGSGPTSGLELSCVEIDGGVHVTEYLGRGGNVTIPSAVHGLPVVAIDFHANARWDRIDLLTIPSSVVRIATAVFCGSGLKVSVDGGNPVYASHDGALYDVTMSRLLYVPDGESWSVRDGVTHIAAWAFASSLSLKYVELSDSVTKIGDDAFSGCGRLADISFGSGIREIGAFAFDGCTSLSSVSLPEGFVGLDSFSFLGCTGLRKIVLPDSVRSLGDEAFRDCTSMCEIDLTAKQSFDESDGPLFGSTADFETLPDVVIKVASESCKTTLESLPSFRLLQPKPKIEVFSPAPEPIPVDPAPVPDDPTPVDPTPVVPEEPKRAIVGEVEPVVSATFAATTYDGLLQRAADGAVVGTIQVKAAKPKTNKKTGQATTALTIAIQMAGETKKLSAKGTYDLGLAAEQSFAVKGRGDLALLLGSNGLTGSFEGYQIEAVPNVFALKDATSKARAEAANAAAVGSYNLIADEGSFTVTVAKKGKATVSGTTTDGKKVSVSTQLIVGEDLACVPVIAPKAGLAFTVWLGAEPSVDGLTDAVIGKAWTLAAGSVFAVDADALAALIGDATYAGYFPNGISVEQNGTKWVVAGGAKAGKVVLDKKTGAIDETKLGENPSGLKLTYTAKTGAFKGSFSAYVDNKGKPKAVAVNVSGVLIGSRAYGTAMVKKAGSVEIEIR